MSSLRPVAKRERFLAWLDKYYTFFREEVGGRNATWQEVRLGLTVPRVPGTPALALAQ